MTNIETSSALAEIITDRDYFMKRDELIAHATKYVSTMRVWPRQFHADMTELGYDLEYTESLELIESAWTLPGRLERQKQWQVEDDEKNVKKVWADYAPWNQEERI